MKKQFKNFMRYRFLLGELVKKGIKLKYRRSYLGIMWSLLEPLMEMVVLAFVFGTIFNNQDKTFPVYILSGRLIYSVFSAGTRACLSSIRKNSAMIKKVYVPKYLYPMSSVLFNYVIFLISLIDLVGVCIVLKVYPTLVTLQAIVPLVLLLILTYGVGMILATIGVFFRDLEYLWGVALMMIMYDSAIFYPAERILETSNAWILKYNPLYCIIAMFRSALYGENLHWKMCAYTAVISVGSLLIGIVMFRKKQDEFILHI